MNLDCPHCGRTLPVSGDCPSFCAYCGRPLENPKLVATQDFVPEAAIATQAPGALDTAGPVPETVGGFRLVRLLGAGGMGSVYEAVEAHSGRRVAVKLIASESGVSKDTLERFRQEGRLASVIAHPRCVFVLAADEEAGRPYIVMELMPGVTLNHVVEKNGPLAVADAVVKILDAIEGLQEAHRLGVIHRDVKPGNCFLAEDGRVKIGDFGLAKALSAGAHLTKTGSFLGTPLFASPEQIRNDPLNEQTDVYSVAATLYFLLTGRAPFQNEEATATMARIVSEPAPSPRIFRPEIPAALDKVILRGLERNRDHRWRDLEEFRAALAPFAGNPLSIAGLWRRLGASVIDLCLLQLGGATVALLIVTKLFELEIDPGSFRSYFNVLDICGCFFYFAFFEGLWGWSLGKALLRLRVRSASGSERPGWRRIVPRSFLFSLLVRGDALLGIAGNTWGVAFLSGEALVWTVPLLGLALVASTMRARNGYRGLHEWFSGTRVIALPLPSRRRVLRARLPGRPLLNLRHPKDLWKRVGAFEIRGAVRWTPELKILVGEDPSLKRTVLIWHRPVSLAPLSDARRGADRATRLRWLAGGKEGGFQWDAFLAPVGSPTIDLVKEYDHFSWTEARPLVEDLAGELAIAAREATIPEQLTVDQVWLLPNGQIQLLDMGFTDAIGDFSELNEPEMKGLSFLHRFAALLLEGKARSANTGEGHIRAVLPGHAAEMLARLRGEPRPYASLDQFQAALKETQNRPTELTRSGRWGHAVLSLGFHLAAMLLYVNLLLRYSPGFGIWNRLVYVGGFAALCMIWTCCTRGGITIPISGVRLVNAAWQKGSRLRCAWRTLWLWAPLVVYFGFIDWLATKVFDVRENSVLGTLDLFLFLFVIAHFAFTLWSPSQSYHDRIAGTYLAPR